MHTVRTSANKYMNNYYTRKSQKLNSVKNQVIPCPTPYESLSTPTNLQIYIPTNYRRFIGMVYLDYNNSNQTVAKKKILTAPHHLRQGVKSKTVVFVLIVYVGPWSNGYQCGMRIPRPGFVCQIIRC